MSAWILLGFVVVCLCIGVCFLKVALKVFILEWLAAAGSMSLNKVSPKKPFQTIPSIYNVAVGQNPGTPVNIPF